MHIARVLLCFDLAWYRSNLPISFRLFPLSLGQWRDCANAIEATLNNKAKYLHESVTNESMTTAKQSITKPCVHFMGYYSIIIRMGSANENRRYNITSSLIGWAHAQNESLYYRCGHPVYGCITRFYEAASRHYWNKNTHGTWSRLANGRKKLEYNINRVPPNYLPFI